MKHAPVLIVGAGPVGLATALSLTQSGIAVRIIDRLAEPTNQSRAAVVHARTLEMFERLGIASEFVDIGVRVHGAAVYGPNKTLLTRPSLDHLPTHYPFMLGIDQATTERLLRERLSALGVEVERPVEFIGLAQSASAVTVRLRSGTDAPRIEEFSYVVGADGARGTVRGALGLKLEGETLDATWITADVKIRWDRDPDEAVAFLSPEGLAFIAPMNGDRWRVIVNLHKLSKAEGEAITLEDVQTIVRDRLGVQAPLYDPVWISPFNINTRMTPTMKVGRVFLAGDAAHVHSPVGGQGMNTGIQDGLNLAWKLAAVLKGQSGEPLLESYNAERHANARALLQKVGPMTKMVNLRQPVAVELRNMVIRVVGQLGFGATLARDFSMLGVGYPNSPAVEDHRASWLDRGPRAGERAPDAEDLLFGDDTPRRLFELWTGDSRHQLLLFSGRKPKAEQLAELAGIAAEFGGLEGFLRVLLITNEGFVPGCAVDPDGIAHDAYGAEGPLLFLVRPDGYIGFRAPLADREALRRYLANWFPGVVPV
jgi:2-polyprenyl-6-methoxyphenol hydroxylase and related FAD-dependent oxidoreductases